MHRAMQYINDTCIRNGSEDSPEEELFPAGELDVDAGAEVVDPPPTP